MLMSNAKSQSNRSSQIGERKKESLYDCLSF